ncbi:hypothetical protein ES703_75337 [subsurface metagenome]
MGLNRETYLKIIRREGPGLVPCRVIINYRVWEEYKERLEKIKKESPHVDISIAQDPERAQESYKRDPWGCLWHYPGDYLDGQVVEHPLVDWEKFKEYDAPSPLNYAHWEKLKEEVERAGKEERVAVAGVEHGFLFLKLTYLRGFENFMLDVAEEKKELYKLRDLITEYWCRVVKKYIELGAELINFGDDLGFQDRLPISPPVWRKLIKPAYQKIFSLCRENKREVYLHTDGYIVDIIPDLIEIGVTILNPQDLVNGLPNLERLAKGKTSIDLDIDRQKITVFGKPEEVKAHILNCIETLGSGTGGLTLTYDVYPRTPPENIEAVIRAMEKHYNRWGEKKGDIEISIPLRLPHGQG